MDQLFPCPTCRRHVRAGSTNCPFCGDSLGPAPETAPEPPRGISRSAMLAFGAALAGSAAFGCSNVETSSSAGGGGSGGDTAASVTSGSTSSSSASGSGTGGAGGQGGIGGAGGQGGIGGAGGQGGTGNIQPPYGSPPIDGGP